HQATDSSLSSRAGLTRGRSANGGRGVLIRNNWREHLPWIAFILAAGVVSVYWYAVLLAGTAWEQRPKGSQGALFLYGLAGGAICLFEFLLWPRKRWRVLRLGRTKVWMRAHIWLG